MALRFHSGVIHEEKKKKKEEEQSSAMQKVQEREEDRDFIVAEREFMMRTSHSYPQS